MNKKLGIAISSIIIVVILISGFLAYMDPETRFIVGQLLGIIKTPAPTQETTFEVKTIVTGIPRPSTMAFLEDDILLLEKNTGKVRLIQDGHHLKEEPLVDFNAFETIEGGLLGVTVKDSFVYFYLTESDEEGNAPIADRVYKYYWNGEELENPKLIKSFPVLSIAHHGGTMLTKDGNVYLVRGDQRGGDVTPRNFGVLQNWNFTGPDDTGVIIIVDKDESILTPSKSDNPLEHYYAIGIRNGFGITEDPITKTIWITENGVESMDEINMVEPKYNSGWAKIMGPATKTQIENLPTLDGFTYSDPEFSWNVDDLIPTGLVFPNENWPIEFRDSLFVGTCGLDGYIFNFKLNDDRTGFVFKSENLTDNVFDAGDGMDELILFSNFQCISDLKIGPDNSLYVVSHANNGAIYKITPKN